MAKQKKESSGSEMTFFEHIDDLRPHLVRAVLSFVVIAIVAFAFKGFIIDTLLFGPQKPDFPTNRWLCGMGYALSDFVAWCGRLFDAEWTMDPTTLCINQKAFNLINNKLVGQFNLHIKVAMATAVVLGIPYMLWEIWQFVKPALTAKERKGTRMFVLYVSLGFFAGLLFGYYIIVPLSIHFFVNYNASESIQNLIDIGSYSSQVVSISLISGLIFQLPLLVYFLTRIGLITPVFLRKYRRHAIIILAVLAAIITPPDPFSLVLVMLPLYGLYELSIFLSVRTEKRYYKEETTEEIAPS